MITVRIDYDKQHFIRFLTISGHAGFAPAGADVVCAAVSALARTFAQVTAAREGIELTEDAPRRGEYSLALSYRREAEPFLEAAQTYLVTGLQTTAAEYPDCVRITTSSA